MMSKSFSERYGYASDAGGIRHGSSEHAKVGSGDARYILIWCSAFVNYVTEKAQKAGVKL